MMMTEGRIKAFGVFEALVINDFIETTFNYRAYELKFFLIGL